MPIESFIDYFCLVFPTNNQNDHKAEKMKVFTEYKTIVNANLNKFLKDILAYSKADLGLLLDAFDDEIDYEDVIYILAVEDYGIFHEFMFEANQELDRKAHQSWKRKFRNNAAASGRAGGNVTEEDLIQQAIRDSMTDQSGRGRVGGAAAAEDDEIQRAIRESMR